MTTLNFIEQAWQSDLNLQQSLVGTGLVSVGTIVNPMVLETFSDYGFKHGAQGIWTAIKRIYDRMMADLPEVFSSPDHLDGWGDPGAVLAPARLQPVIEHFVRYEIEKAKFEGRWSRILK